jgi:hypothetical protein
MSKLSNFNSKSFSIQGEDNDLGLEILKEHSKNSTVKEAIIDLYLNVKIRNSEDVRTLVQ